ncbi:FIG054221: Possible conserved alanine rich membrane protein [Alloactinosynnema sp. L-07]|uniref:type II secretion system F family protein n=1 Tax=Alloactinosynnema sp. L-07 TaxID=1653480 RepID=UPI00065F036B|nr:type II secretion system F family protein [Alloactinosynnema sp. L-07]CRK61077.1 FIG054221: Possible conserved alanine rich membrane protein [Alloactinosynnema sp. L-07]
MTALLLAIAVLIGFPHRSAPTRLARLFGSPRPGGRFWPPKGKRFRRLFRRSSGWTVPSQAPPPATRHPPRRFAFIAAVSAGVLFGLALGLVAGIVAAPIAGWVTFRAVRGRAAPVDEATLAATWDLLAACLTAGMPVPTAIRAIAVDLPDQPGRALRDVAGLLAMGGDPVEAWAGALNCPQTAALARGARRTARSGAALAGVARDLAADVRARAADDAEARAQRVAVLATGPLALCFLPAFLCLGIVPVVLGMTDVLSNQL